VSLENDNNKLTYIFS